MADRTAELTLLLKARNLSDSATRTAAAGLDNVVSAAGRVRGAMQGLGNATAIGLGMAAETLASGGSMIEAASQLGLHMVSELTETFGGQLIAKLTSGGLIAAITAPISAVGTAIGGMIAAAIPAGMALLPVILIGAIVAAIAVLILNEDIRNKVFAFVGELIGNIVRFLGELPGKLIDLFSGIWTDVTETVGPFVDGVVDFFLGIPGRLVELGGNIVKAIIDGLVSLPGKIADVIREAFAKIDIRIGPFHITGRGVTIDLPKIEPGPNGMIDLSRPYYNRVPGAQHGGWVGLHGPEVRMLGEAGPEYVIPNHALGTGGPLHLTLNLDGRRFADVILPHISAAMYYDLRDAAPSRGSV